MVNLIILSGIGVFFLEFHGQFKPECERGSLYQSDVLILHSYIRKTIEVLVLFLWVLVMTSNNISIYGCFFPYAELTLQTCQVFYVNHSSFIWNNFVSLVLSNDKQQYFQLQLFSPYAGLTVQTCYKFFVDHQSFIWNKFF